MATADKLTVTRLVHRRMVFLWSSVGVLLLAALGVAVYTGSRNIQSQNEEIDFLVGKLALTTGERNDLLRTSSDLSERLSESAARVAALEADVHAAVLEKERLEEDARLLRERLQAARLEVREAVSETEAVQRAREREARLAGAALAYADAASALSRTRDRMIDVLRDQIAAERAGRTATARTLLSEYNTLVSVHNQQVVTSNTALVNLRALLR